MSDDFKPSDVYLGVPPLVGTMGHAEREFAAALIVRACQVEGDAWHPIGPAELGRVIKADIAAGTEPIASLNQNPFFKPNFYELADGEHGRWVGEPGKSPLELTAHGIEMIRVRQLGR